MTAALQDLGAGIASGCASRVGVPSPPPCTTITVPAPPSVNKLFKSIPNGGRAKTREYKNWLAEAGWMLREQMPDAVFGRVVISLCVERTNLRADIDNTCKALLDLLVLHHVIEDDRYVVGFLAAWSPPANVKRPVARLAVMQAGPLIAHFHPAPDGATGGWFINAQEQEEAA